MRITTLLFLAGLAAAVPAVSPAEAGTQDGAKVAFHVRGMVSKNNPCSYNNDPNSQNIGCTGYTYDWTTHSPAWVYLVVAGADSTAGVSYLSVGVARENPTTNATWFQCLDATQVPSVSPPWPDSGSGNAFTWVSCQQNNIAGEGTHAIAGAFYMYAYGTDLLSLTPNYAGGSTDITVQDCAAGSSIIPSNQTARLGFDCSGSYNPCLGGPIPPGCPYLSYAITSIADIDPDQGKQVRIQWWPHDNDASGAGAPITSYGIYRRIDPLPPAAAPGPLREVAPESYPPGSWDYVTSVPATAEAEYNTVVSTLCDSCWTAFFVRAQTDTPWVYFDTPPDSGMSFDNLAPMAPAAPLVNPAYLLSWQESEDADFKYFTVYGSNYESLDGNAVVLGHTVDTQLDVAAAPYPFYHVTATDFAGNEGAASRQTSTAATGAGSPVAVELGPTVDLGFNTVTTAGETQLVLRSQGNPPPAGFQVVPSSPPLYYEFSTTAVFDQVTISITYDETAVQGPESGLSLWHYDEIQGQWVDVTLSVDTVNNIVRGQAGSFSTFMVAEPTSSTDVPAGPPAAFLLHPAFPNPFSRSARIHYDLPKESPVRLRVYDLNGRLVRTLEETAAKPAGRHAAFWDGLDDEGVRAQNGVYFFRLETPRAVTAAKAVLIR